MKNLFELADRFRKAIIEAKYNRDFASDLRMYRFPNGCCDDAADLFAHYLYVEYNIVSIRVDGSYDDVNDFENNCNHSWLEIGDTIVDLTGSQDIFKYNPLFLCYSEDVYVGPMDDFHKLFRIYRRKKSYGIDSLGKHSHNRMYKLYNTIMNYMN